MGAGFVIGALLASPCLAQSTAPVTLSRPTAVAPAKPFARLSNSAHALRDSIVALTRLQLGVKYRRGAQDPGRGFDCSGLVKYVMEHFGAQVPRTSREQAMVGKEIEKNVASLKPGDLLTFGRGRRISHIGIYIGNGRYVHAPTPGARVREANLSDVRAGWWKGARRLFAFDDTPSDSSAN
jgi:cell wall-associated NlpC family hydrolase